MLTLRKLYVQHRLKIPFWEEAINGFAVIRFTATAGLLKRLESKIGIKVCSSTVIIYTHYTYYNIIMIDLRSRETSEGRTF